MKIENITTLVLIQCLIISCTGATSTETESSISSSTNTSYISENNLKSSSIKSSSEHKYSSSFMSSGKKQGNSSSSYRGISSQTSSSKNEISSSSIQISSSNKVNSSSSIIRIEGESLNYDGTIYKTTIIGTQTWTASNLVNINSSGQSYCYDEDMNNCEIYGRLYDWEAAMSICPTGWRLPSDEDWQLLEKNIGMSDEEVVLSQGRGNDQGPLLKSEGAIWKGNMGTNNTGFSALPGGNYEYNYTSGEFRLINIDARFWTSTSNGTNYAITRGLSISYQGISRTSKFVKYGLSVRCLKI